MVREGEAEITPTRSVTGGAREEGVGREERAVKGREGGRRRGGRGEEEEEVRELVEREVIVGKDVSLRVGEG